MYESAVSSASAPVLVVAYDEKARAALAASTAPYGVDAVSCASFREAQDYARFHSCRGIMVDMATMIGSNDEEKTIAWTITTLYPALRVKSMGAMLIPMAMAGDVNEQKSLKEFLTTTCERFAPRRMRAHRRRDFCIPTRIAEGRGFTTNISWGGAFIVDTCSERFSIGDDVSVRFLFQSALEVSGVVVVVRHEGWEEHRPPGIGVRFKEISPELERNLALLLRTDKDHDRDRLA
jgi:Tfp pilus assembly protein PilZ